MAIKAKTIEGFEPSNFSHSFFLDSNVWMYLIFPQHSTIAEKHIKNYSSLFEKIKKKDCIIFTDIIQISELVNLILRIEYKKYLKANSCRIEFKEFRMLDAGKKALMSAKTLIQIITKSATISSGVFSSEELKVMANDCDKADFNDVFFANFCQKKKAILVTHDFDFNALKVDLEVLSANENYL
ncbi:MAG: hypothetical protein J0L87_14240 [Bacteroidetes bacterium]|nr:hypothetical protein [Bacteroidota bacterium]